MSALAALIILIGLPLILLAIGFVIIAVKIFGGGSDRLERGQTLEAARQIERSLALMENRLSALEDILLSADRRKGVTDE
mgnify:CR=1 FL=1